MTIIIPKIKISSLLLVFIFIAGCAVHNKVQLEQQFLQELTTSCNFYNDRKMNEYMELTYPKIFDLSPREDLIHYFNWLDSLGSYITVDVLGIEGISDIKEYGSEKFCLIRYHANLKVKLSGAMIDNSQLLLTQYINIYGGPQFVNYIEEDHTIYVDGHLKAVAIANKDDGKWKYLEYNKQRDNIMKLLIPEEIRKAIIDPLDSI